MKPVHFELETKKLEELKDLTDKLGAVSVAEVIRSSIDLFLYINKQKLTGKRVVLVDDKKNCEREIVLISK